ncbi:MAG: pyridoxamine 5'-phosphate oxidase family protein, partial [Acetobacteraceae bacterium]
GQPYCTPTAFWREDDHLYWHGSSASRMLRAEAKGIPVCLTVTHMDAIVLARCGFNHSINYRAVMAFGHARPIEGPAAKLRAMDAFIDRFFPGRAAALRPPSAKEIKATMLVGMRIEDASAKIRDMPVHDEEADYAHPVWTELVPVQTVLGTPVPCPRQAPGVRREAGGMEAYQPGRRLDEVMAEMAARYAPSAEPQ